MTLNIKLYGMGQTRSARCRWTLDELGLAYEYVDDRRLLHSDEICALHPQGKLPAIVINDQALFESAAICEYLCDLVGEPVLIGAVESYARALHAQWTAFVLTELDAYLWSDFKHTRIYPEEIRAASVRAANATEIQSALRVLDSALATRTFLVNNRFSVTDIIAGWSINWAANAGHLEPYTHLSRYLARLQEREHCPLKPG